MSVPTLERGWLQHTADIDRATAEQLRLHELSWLRFLDNQKKQRFDRYTRLVADVFGVTMANISRIDYAPRRLSKAERARLIAFARLVEDEINTGRREGVTGLPEAASVDESLDRALRLRLVAEGIETPAQLAALNALNCNEGQGFHLGRPESADKLLEQLRERNGWA